MCIYQGMAEDFFPPPLLIIQSPVGVWGGECGFVMNVMPILKDSFQLFFLELHIDKQWLIELAWKTSLPSRTFKILCGF